MVQIAIRVPFYLATTLTEALFMPKGMRGLAMRGSHRDRALLESLGSADSIRSGATHLEKLRCALTCVTLHRSCNPRACLQSPIQKFDRTWGKRS